MRRLALLEEEESLPVLSLSFDLCSFLSEEDECSFFTSFLMWVGMVSVAWRKPWRSLFCFSLNFFCTSLLDEW